MPELEDYTFEFEGTISGVRYVTVLDSGGNPMEYNIPEDDAIERYRTETE